MVLNEYARNGTDMGNHRMPGPLCSLNQQETWDDDILGLAGMSHPGPLCGHALQSPAAPGAAGSVHAAHHADLEPLFHSCLNPGRGLSEIDYRDAAKALGVEVAAIQAVAEVETSGAAFDEDGRPRILFERHYFHRLTGGRHAAKHARISNKHGGGYGKFSSQYPKLEEAFRLDPDAALRSASWGRFQIMGDNFRAAGFDCVCDFVLAHVRAESGHLTAFVNFVSSHKSMAHALATKHWADFARAYNGKGYKLNDYDNKMAKAYTHLTKPAVPKKPGH